MNFIEAMKICEAGMGEWKAKPHNAKWWKQIDGTPIPNDLLVCIAEKIAVAGELPLAAVAPDTWLLDAKVICIDGRDEFGEPLRTLHMGIDLRKAIKLAIEQAGDRRDITPPIAPLGETAPSTIPDAMPAPQGFLDYISANYRGDVFFSDPEWHAMRIWDAAMRWMRYHSRATASTPTPERTTTPPEKLP